MSCKYYLMKTRDKGKTEDIGTKCGVDEVVIKS